MKNLNFFFHFFQLIGTISKTRHASTSGYQAVDRSASPVQLCLSESEDDPDKENQCIKDNHYRSKSVVDSSDDDFDQCE